MLHALCGLARSSLPRECRTGAVELLLTLAEGAPKMCAKLDPPGYACALLEALLPMMLRLPEDSTEWEEGEPLDGLAQGDDDDEAEAEAAYALEGLDRLCGALDGDSVGPLLLERLGSLLGASGGSSWQATHVALVAVAVVSEHCQVVLTPHVPSLAGSIATNARAALPRVRWASFYSLAVLSDEFGELAEAHHSLLLPPLILGLSDTSSRVQAAAAVAAVQLCGGLPAGVLDAHLEPLLRALHTALSSAAIRPFVVRSVAAAIAAVATHAGTAVGPYYSGLMPLLRQRLQHASATKASTLLCALVDAFGCVAHAAGGATVGADPQCENDVRGLVALLASDALSAHPAAYSFVSASEVGESGVDVVHAALAKFARLLPARFAPLLGQLVPPLLQAAGLDPDFSISRVEIEEEDDDDDYEVSYTPEPSGRGLIRSRVNVSQTAAKIGALRALAAYAAAQRARFLPFLPAAVAAVVPVLAFRFHPSARATAASALAACYRCGVLAARGESGTTLPRDEMSSLLEAIAKPIGAALSAEEEPEPAEAMLAFFQQVAVGMVVVGTAVGMVVGMVVPWDR